VEVLILPTRRGAAITAAADSTPAAPAAKTEVNKDSTDAATPDTSDMNK
jgi:hypothetical protein